MIPLAAGKSAGMGAESIGVVKTISAPGLATNAIVIPSITANSGEDIFGLHAEVVGEARDGEFDVYVTAQNGGQDTQWCVTWIAVNP